MTEAIVAQQDTAEPAPTAAISAPLLFLHIPKTAGTSFLTVLANAFGDTRMRRLGDGETTGSAMAAILAAPEMTSVRCLAGHFPLHAFADQIERLRVFTILRHPVERVFSLYRFLRRANPDILARMGLGADFDFNDFVTCRRPEVFGQIRNGMCRLLSNNPRLADGNDKTFFRRFSSSAAADPVAMLSRIDFGISEDMPGTLEVARDLLGLPFPLSEQFENASEPSGAERNARNVLRLIELNTCDLTLYHEGLRIFRERLDRLAAAGTRPTSVADVPLLERGAKFAVKDIPGRQGFHGYEPGPGFSWLLGTDPSRLAFAAQPGPAKLMLQVYCVSETYPAEEIVVAVNDVVVPHRFIRVADRWGVIETGPFEPSSLNLLRLAVPYTVPARFLSPGTKDRRALSVALSSIMLADA